MGRVFDGEVLIYEQGVDKSVWKYWIQFLIPWVLLAVFSYGYFFLIFGSFVMFLPVFPIGMGIEWFSKTASQLFVVGLFEGAYIGVFQWVLLRKHIIQSKRWILITALGYAFGNTAGELFNGTKHWSYASELTLAREWWLKDNLGWNAQQIHQFEDFLGNLICFVIVAAIQSLELRVWFYNSYLWMLTALPLAFLEPFTIFSGLLLNRNESSLIIGGITGIIMVYFLQREYEIEKDEQLEELALSETSL